MKNYELDDGDSEWDAFYLNDEHIIIKDHDENIVEINPEIIKEE